MVTLLNKMGHCPSYDDVEVVNTSLAMEISARSEEHGIHVVVPSNISPGIFLQFAGDNNDLNEETLHGKQTTHATTLLAYQKEQYGPKWSFFFGFCFLTIKSKDDGWFDKKWGNPGNILSV